MARTLLGALTSSLRDEPGRPFVTFYDDASGERVELSLATFDNWVSKVANLFSDEIGVAPGDRLEIALPTHWLSPIVVVGGWAAGLALAASGVREGSDLRIVGPDAVERSGSAPTVPTVACSLRPLGGRFLQPLPPGWLDFAVEVPPQPDAILVPHPVDPADLAIDASVRLSHGELLEVGEQRASGLGLRPGGRLATDLNAAEPTDLVTALAAPIAAAASVVLVVNATPERRALIAEQERVSCEAWSS